MAAKKNPSAADEPTTPWAVDVFTHAIAFVPGAKRMLSGHALSNEILEWDLDTGNVVVTRRKGRKSKDGVNGIAVRADGKQFIAVDQSGMAGSMSFVRVWPLGAKNTKEPELELIGHKGPVASCAYLPDGRALTGGRDGTLRLWDLAEGGQQIHEMQHDDQIVALVIAPDGKSAATGGFDHVTDVKRWDLEKGEQSGVVATFDSPCVAMQLSPEGKRLACMTHAGALHVVDWASGKPLVEVKKAHEDSGQSAVTWSPDGALLVSVSQFDETVRVWRAEDGAPLHSEKLARPNMGAFGPDGILYVALAYERISRWRLDGSGSGALIPLP